MMVPEIVNLDKRDWHGLSPLGRIYVENLAKQAEKPLPSLKDLIAGASDEELEALPYIGPENKDNFRAWAKGEEIEEPKKKKSPKTKD